MKRLPLWLALALAACSGSADDGPGLNVSFLDMPAGTIPAAVTTISIDVYTDGSDAGPANSQHTIMNLMDTGDGHKEVAQPHLPTNVRVRVVVTGLDAMGQKIYVGHVGPMVLVAGERRYVDLALYPVGTSTSITTTVYTPSLLPTATTLLDGRVLIAGGFVTPALHPCPAGEATGSICLLAAATRDAYVFLPDNGAFYRLPSGMLAPRGGQSATRLSDGRVLLAGGASSLLIVATPLTAGYSIDLRPRDMANTLVTVASYELFDPDQGTVIDPLREGDPQRGGFLGAADAPTTPGPLNHGRMLHAATLVPRMQGDLVLLAGGQGAADTWEVWDAHRVGGYGVYASPGALLHTQRTYPSAITVGPAATPTVWIVGGAAATSNDDLAEIWTPAMMTGNGTTSVATSHMYPTGSATMMDHPELALSHPALGVVGGGSAMVVAGWLGPHCVVGTAPTGMPVWYGGGGGMPDEQCDQRVPQIRSTTATVNLMTGASLAESMPQQHGFGASAAMSDGGFALVGGFATVGLTVQGTIDVFDGTVTASPMVHARLLTAPHMMSRPRALHASAALAGRGILTVGGLTLDGTTLAPTMIAQPEVVYLDAVP